MHPATVLFLFLIVVVALVPLAVLVAWGLDRRRGSAEDDRESVSRVRPGVAVLVVAFLAVLVTAGILVAAGRDTGGESAAMEGMPMGEGASATGAPEVTTLLPETLGDLRRSHVVVGAEALQEVRQLHVSEFPMTSAEIAHYEGPGGTAMVWVAATADPEMSARMTAQMADRIAEGGTPFEPPKEQANGVWTTTGMDQLHYFWFRGSKVWWLAADPAVAKRALSSLTH